MILSGSRVYHTTTGPEYIGTVCIGICRLAECILVRWDRARTGPSEYPINQLQVIS